MPGDVDPQLLTEVRRLVAAEPELVQTARDRASDLHPPDPEVGALLAWAARTVDASTVVEVGSAGGVSGWWLASALPERGVLTSIEPDPHAHGLATAALEPSTVQARVRSILGEPATVLPRLSDGAYDLALLQPVPAATPDLLDHARRLLRLGGVLLVRGALRPGDHAEILARFLQALTDDPQFTSTVLAVDDGLVLATRCEPAEADDA